MTRSICFFMFVVMVSCQQDASRFDRKLFRAADTDSDQKLSFAEANKAELSRVFEDVDTNADGAVTYAEAVEIHPEFNRTKYNEYDVNGNGSVTAAEFYKIQTAKGGIRLRFDAADANRDGFVTLPEADERVKWLMDQAEGSW